MKLAGYSVRHIAPSDAQRSDVEDFWKDEERKADCERKQLIRKQEKEQSMPSLSKRARIVHDILRKALWADVAAIAKAAALRNQRNRLLAPDAACRAVHRALDKLVEHGLVEFKSEIGKHGMVVKFARRVHTVGQNSVIADNVIADKKASGDVANPIKPGTSAPRSGGISTCPVTFFQIGPTDTPVAVEAKADSTMEVLAGSPPSQPTSDLLEGPSE